MRRTRVLRPPKPLYVSNCCSQSPCGVQSEKPENIVAQFRQSRIAAVPGIGTIDCDISLDARRTVTKNHDAIGEEQCFLDIVGHQERRKSFPLPERDDFGL